MNELIIPPEQSRPKKDDATKYPIEIVVERRGHGPKWLAYGLATAFLGLVVLAGLRTHGPDENGNAAPKLTETKAAQVAPAAALDEAAQRHIAALQNEVRDLRTKLDAMEKRQQTVQVSAPPAPPEVKPQTSPAQAAPVTQQPPAKAEPTVARAARTEGAKSDAAPVQTIPPASKIVKGYRVRDVYRGAALIEYGSGMIGVEPGEVVPGVGRVKAIQERAGRWVVVTENGEIMGETRGQPRPSAPRRRNFSRELYGFMPGPFAPPFFLP